MTNYLNAEITSGTIPERATKYPFSKMEPNQSFPILNKEDVQSIRNASRYYGIKHGKKFVVRLDADGYPRCWRVS